MTLSDVVFSYFRLYSYIPLVPINQTSVRTKSTVVVYVSLMGSGEGVGVRWGGEAADHVCYKLSGTRNLILLTNENGAFRGLVCDWLKSSRKYLRM